MAVEPDSGCKGMDELLARDLNSLLPQSFWSTVHRLTTGDSWPPTSIASAGHFVETCAWHSLLPLLFAEPALPPIVCDAREALRSRERSFAIRSLLYRDAVVTVCRVLGDEPVALIKGADFAYRLYPTPSLRPMQDVDLLVPSERIDPVCRLLRNAGFESVPGLGGARDPAHHERQFRFGTMLFEIHQSFIQRPRHRIDYEGIWQRRVPLEVGDQRASRLDDVDALIYQLLTMSSIDQFYPVQFIRLVDLWILLRRGDGIALAAVERAREWQIAHGLYASLSYACRSFPEFRTNDVSAAMASALSGTSRWFIDRFVLPAPMEIRRTRRPRRWVQLWRKAWLMDTTGRRIAFALSHAFATFRSGCLSSKSQSRHT